MGKTLSTLKKYFLYLLPTLCLILFIEDFTNMNSPRRNLYKGYLGIPDFKDFMVHEVINIFEKPKPKSGDKEDEDEEMDQDYWSSLQPIEYKSKEEVVSMSQKQFMVKHIRQYLPGVFRGITSDSLAFT
jgi:hypothetical protein